MPPLSDSEDVWNTLFQVNGTELSLLGYERILNGLSNKPSNSFPFKRLATCTKLNSTAAYLYHQLDGTTIGEEEYDLVRGVWRAAKNITIEV